MSFNATEGEHSNKKIFYPKHLLELPRERQTVIYGFAPGRQKIRIRPQTHLCCPNGTEIKMLFYFGIPMYPNLKEGVDQTFVLIFDALPKEDCETFIFREAPSGVGCFLIYAIERNAEDVYRFSFGMPLK